MKYDPSYRSGTYISELNRLWAGWTCHEGSFSGRMPVWNETKDICLIFSGEDFNDIHCSKDHRCTENADYLIHLYEEMGVEFVEKLNGWFSGLLVDSRRQITVLFNDRYGLGRIYYHQNANGFYFSSEAKSLLRVLPELRELDLACLAESFSVGCVLRNRTLFPKIALVPGGSRWIFNGALTPKKENYFSPESWQAQAALMPDEYCERLKEVFARILPKYLKAETRVAMSLTGGLDCRMIMAWAKQPPGKLPCYTFSGPYRDTADLRIARRVAQLSRQPHETISLGTSFLAEFPALAEKAVYVSDGAMDVSGAVELYVNRIAKQIAPVRLTGNYGSEILRGNIAFQPMPLDRRLFAPEFDRFARSASETYAKESECDLLSFVAFKQVPWHHYSRLSLEMSQLTPRSPYLDNDLVALAFQAPKELLLSKGPCMRLISDGSRVMARIPTDRGLLLKPLPVMTRCRHLYEEFTFKAEYAYDYGMPQWLAGLDHFLAPLRLERIFLGRHKFYHFRVWYRDELAGYVKEVLLDPRSLSRPYLNRRRTDEMVMAHTSGSGNHTLDIHRLLSAELIQRQLVEMT